VAGQMLMSFISWAVLQSLCEIMWPMYMWCTFIVFEKSLPVFKFFSDIAIFVLKSSNEPTSLYLIVKGDENGS